MLNIYFDVDGVLGEYKASMFKGDNPPFLQRGSHCFRNLPYDEDMVKTAKWLINFREQMKLDVYVLTTIRTDTAMFNEHFHDRILWLRDILPEIDIEHILISTTNKRDCVEFIRNCELDETHILIDDYNVNLNEWQAGGGIAIKYLNGVNSPDSFNGPKVRNGAELIKFITERGK